MRLPSEDVSSAPSRLSAFLSQIIEDFLFANRSSLQEPFFCIFAGMGGKGVGICGLYRGGYWVRCVGPGLKLAALPEGKGNKSRFLRCAAEEQTKKTKQISCQRGWKGFGWWRALGSFAPLRMTAETSNYRNKQLQKRMQILRLAALAQNDTFKRCAIQCVHAKRVCPPFAR